jgi:hypothetical protein
VQIGHKAGAQKIKMPGKTLRKNLQVLAIDAALPYSCLLDQ